MQSVALATSSSLPNTRDEGTQRRAQSLTWCVEDVNSTEDLDRLSPQLEAIDQNDSGITLFQTSGWLTASAHAALGQSRTTVRILLAERDSRIVAALAMSIRSVLGIRIATPLGAPLAQYCDVLMEDAAFREARSTILRDALALLPNVDVFWFRRVRSDAKIDKLIRALGGQEISQSGAPFADLKRHADFHAFLKVEWKAHRNRNRLRRRAANDATLTFEVAASPSRAAELTRRAVDLKRRWLQSKFRLFGTLRSQDWCEALISAVEQPSLSTHPVVTAICARGKPAAVEVGFVRRGRYYAFLGAFDPEFKDWSPTELLMEDTIRWCFHQAIDCYDLLPPDDPYKKKWTNDSVGISDWIICRSLVGRICITARYRLLLPLAQGVFDAITRIHERAMAWFGTRAR